MEKIMTNRIHKFLFCLVLFILVSCFNPSRIKGTDVGRFDMIEISFTISNEYTNPFTEVDFTVDITCPSTKQIKVRGFYDGNGRGKQSGYIWKFRFMPQELGKYRYITISNDSQLDGIKGKFNCVPSNRKGPVRVSPYNAHLTIYENGDPFIPIGDCAFFLRSENWKRKTRLKWIDNMASMRVNKIIICMVNDADKDVYPWLGKRRSIKYARFNLARMRMWEEVFERMRQKGIIAYLWFYSDDSKNLLPMANSEEENQYFKYMIARFAAYENIVWNLALEYQEYRTKKWAKERATFIKDEDPYDHLIAVHQTPGRLFTCLGAKDLDIFSHQGPLNTAQKATSLILKIHGDSIQAARPIIIWPEEWIFDPPFSERDRVIETMWGITLQGGGYTIMSRNFWQKAGKINWWNDYGKTLADLMDRLEGYHKMKVGNNLTNDGGITKFCMARAGHEYLILTINTVDVELDLTGALGMFVAEWWNPITGDVNSAGIIRGGGIRTFEVPFVPAVLYVKKQPVD